MHSSLKAQANSSAETVSYPKEAHYGSQAELENTKQQFSDEANHLAKINGILVVASKPVHLFEEVQRNSILAKFGQDQGITGENFSDVPCYFDLDGERVQHMLHLISLDIKRLSHNL